MVVDNKSKRKKNEKLKDCLSTPVVCHISSNIQKSSCIIIVRLSSKSLHIVNTVSLTVLVDVPTIPVQLVTVT